MRNDINVIRAAFDDNYGEDINITLVNPGTGVVIKEGCNYLPENTLEQVLQDKTKDLGLSEIKKVVAVNKDTGKDTRDLSMTLDEFGIRDGSVLGFKDGATIG